MAAVAAQSDKKEELAMPETSTSLPTPLWQRRLWIGVASALGLTGLLLLLLVGSTVSRMGEILDKQSGGDLGFTFSGMALLTLTLLRLLVSLAGRARPHPALDG
jgi:hypothetical protein